MELDKNIYKVSEERKEGTQHLSLGMSRVETLARRRETINKDRMRTERLITERLSTESREENQEERSKGLCQMLRMNQV